jgi:hypothetical protein
LKTQELNIKTAEFAQKLETHQEKKLTELQSAAILESEARHVIIHYCEGQGYLINGFPADMKRRYENNVIRDEEYFKDYFCDERFDHYLDSLTLKKSNVAKWNEHYTSGFEQAHFESKDIFIETIKSHGVDYGFYDVSL